MHSLVLELQQEAINPQGTITDLLRKALLVAKKLGITEFQEWADNELNGYEKVSDLPKYRLIRGYPQVLDHFHGWQPIRFHDSDDEEYWGLWKCTEPISLILALVDPSNKEKVLSVSYSIESSEALLKSVGATSQVRCMVGYTSLAPILDSVKNIVLNWSIKLEQDGILGESFTFSAKEREIAQTTTYNINNFYGSVTSSQIQQNSSKSVQELKEETVNIEPLLNLLDEIRENLSDLKLPGYLEDELQAEIDTVDAQAKSPKPKTSIIKESFSSIRRILEGAGGSIAAQLLMSLGSIQF